MNKRNRRAVDSTLIRYGRVKRRKGMREELGAGHAIWEAGTEISHLVRREVLQKM